MYVLVWVNIYWYGIQVTDTRERMDSDGQERIDTAWDRVEWIVTDRRELILHGIVLNGIVFAFVTCGIIFTGSPLTLYPPSPQAPN
jgi:hypothetical protein